MRERNVALSMYLEAIKPQFCTAEIDAKHPMSELERAFVGIDSIILLQLRIIASGTCPWSTGGLDAGKGGPFGFLDLA